MLLNRHWCVVCISFCACVSVSVPVSVCIDVSLRVDICLCVCMSAIVKVEGVSVSINYEHSRENRKFYYFLGDRFRILLLLPPPRSRLHTHTSLIVREFVRIFFLLSSWASSSPSFCCFTFCIFQIGGGIYCEWNEWALEWTGVYVDVEVNGKRER